MNTIPCFLGLSIPDKNEVIREELKIDNIPNSKTYETQRFNPAFTTPILR
jgi:hypothetical protein